VNAIKERLISAVRTAMGAAVCSGRQHRIRYTLNSAVPSPAPKASTQLTVVRSHTPAAAPPA
jgi:hypothetical protein